MRGGGDDDRHRRLRGRLAAREQRAAAAANTPAAAAEEARDCRAPRAEVARRGAVECKGRVARGPRGRRRGRAAPRRRVARLPRRRLKVHARRGEEEGRRNAGRRAVRARAGDGHAAAREIEEGHGRGVARVGRVGPWGTSECVTCAQKCAAAAAPPKPEGHVPCNLCCAALWLLAVAGGLEKNLQHLLPP